MRPTESAARSIGTPAYLAPERLAGGTVRPATDVYALGLLLYMALAGRMPWRASTTTQMLRAHRYLDPSALPPVEGLPYEVADLCHQCLAKDPADRPSAAAAARILADAAGVTPAASLLATLDAPTEEIRTRRPAPSADRGVRDRVPAAGRRHRLVRQPRPAA